MRASREQSRPVQPVDRRQWLATAAGTWLLAAETAASAGRRVAPPRHAALHVYSRPLVRPRHAAVLGRALARRAEVHTSGWAEGTDGLPILAVGPVHERGAHWHGTKKVKPMRPVWPFAAVLEFDGRGKGVAYVDWFRRARGSTSPGGWLLDPNLGYVDHINAEVVCDRDERWHYLALVDTPTGGHVGGSELVVRARVDWADGTSVRKGWWLWFDAPDDRPPDTWTAPQIPLVDWRVVGETPRLGIVATAPVEDRERELSPWGTKEVFRFPAMPPGLQPCRGGD